MSIHYLVIFLICGIFIGEGQTMSPGRGGAPKRVGGGGVSSPGAPLVSPGLPCKDIKDEKDIINCFSNRILDILPRWFADKKINDREYEWLRGNIKSLLEEIQIAGKLRDNKYIYEFIKKRANRDGIFTEKFSKSPAIGIVILTYVLNRLADAIKDPLYRDRLDDAFDNSFWVTDLNPNEEIMVERARVHALQEKLFILKAEKVLDIERRGRRDFDRPGRGGGEVDGGGGTPIGDLPQRGPGHSMTKSTTIMKYSGW